MTALSDAEQAVAEARRDVHEHFWPLAAPVADEARKAVARLEAAVSRLDAEVILDAWNNHGRPGHPVMLSARNAADLIRPEVTP